jgi:hypothetical protein
MNQEHAVENPACINPNPEGIKSSSPTLRGTSYVGFARPVVLNRNAVAPPMNLHWLQQPIPLKRWKAGKNKRHIRPKLF